jgi:hypothetical protein
MAFAAHLVGDNWVIDLGATNHMANSQHWFSTYSPMSGQVVLSSGHLNLVSIGDVTLPWILTDGTICCRTMKDVLHVPGLCTNLLSTMRARTKGLYFDGNTDTFRIKGTHEVFGSTRVEGNVWLLNLHAASFNNSLKALFTRDESATASTTSILADFWYRCHEHPGATAFHLTVRQISGLTIPTALRLALSCELCQLAKAHRVVSGVPRPIPGQVLKVVHSDVAGHITPIGKGGVGYVKFFTDGH